MNQILVGLVVLGAMLAIVAVVVTYNAVKKAPDGYEDSDGFHKSEPAQQPEASPGEAVYYN